MQMHNDTHNEEQVTNKTESKIPIWRPFDSSKTVALYKYLLTYLNRK